MEFKHEKSLKSRLLDWKFNTWEEVHQFKREYDELEEVYIKAKAFDEIKKSIIQIKCNYKGNEERINKFIARETEYIMNRKDR